MKVLSLFDGISCAQLALQGTGKKIEYYASEIDQNAIKVTQRHFPNTAQLGDVRNVQPFSVDLLIGGSPCQDLSIGGKRKGLKGERSGLLREYVRLLEACKPRYFLLENVASMKPLLKDLITEVLGVEPVLINSSLITAQSRKRLYWTNIPIMSIQQKVLVVNDILEAGRISGFYERRSEPVRVGGKSYQGGRIYSVFGKSVTLCSLAGGGGAKTGLYETANGVRKLTPLECERLQGLPDNYTQGFSNEARYKMINNGFTVPVVQHILQGAVCV